jgi:hypothetical protein
MDNFDTHKWFKKSYLQEGMSDEELADIRKRERLEKDPRFKKDKEVIPDLVALMKKHGMVDEERSLKENMSPAEAVVELNYYMNDLQDISAAVSRIMQQTFPGEYRRGEAYGAFDFGSSRNQFDTTFESILDSLASVGDEDEIE